MYESCFRRTEVHKRQQQRRRTLHEGMSRGGPTKEVQGRLYSGGDSVERTDRRVFVRVCRGDYGRVMRIKQLSFP